MNKRTGNQRQARRKVPEARPAAGIEKLILMSVLVEYVNRARAGIENSVAEYMKKHGTDAFQKAQTDAYMDGVNAMYNLVMRGILDRPLLPSERQQAGTRRPATKKKSEEVK